MENTTKKEIIEKVRKAAEDRIIEQGEEVAIFQTMGGDLVQNYGGDIFNHRVRSYFTFNEINWLVEVTACDERITLHKITKKPLKHIKHTGQENGASIEIDALNASSVERSASGVYGFFGSEKRIASTCLRDDLLTPAHTFRRVLCYINGQLKTNFKKAVLLYTCESNYKTVSEALNDEYMRRDFDTLSDAEYLQLFTVARHVWEGLQFVGIVPSSETFADNCSFISSSSLNGFYFPNSRGPVRAICFDRWNGPEIIINDEE